MSAIKKVVNMLWYSTSKKDRRLANDLAAEFSALEQEIEKLKSRLTTRPLDSAGRCAFYQGVGDEDCWNCKHAPGNQPPSK